MQADKLESLFKSTIDLVWDVYGEDAFRRWTGRGFEKDINAGLFDSIMLTFADYNKSTAKQVSLPIDCLRCRAKRCYIATPDSWVL